jgi:hypothetical protein
LLFTSGFLYWRVYTTPFKEQPLVNAQLWHV